MATGVEKVGSQHLDRTEDIEVHIMTKDEVMQLLVNDEIKQSLMLRRCGNTSIS